MRERLGTQTVVRHRELVVALISFAVIAWVVARRLGWVEGPAASASPQSPDG